MSSYTAIMNGEKLSQILPLPQEFINAEVEVKVRVLKKIAINKLNKPSKFDSFFGIMEIDNIEEEIRTIRDDWN